MFISVTWASSLLRTCFRSQPQTVFVPFQDTNSCQSAMLRTNAPVITLGHCFIFTLNFNLVRIKLGRSVLGESYYSLDIQRTLRSRVSRTVGRKWLLGRLSVSAGLIVCICKWVFSRLDSSNVTRELSSYLSCKRVFKWPRELTAHKQFLTRSLEYVNMCFLCLLAP